MDRGGHCRQRIEVGESRPAAVGVPYTGDSVIFGLDGLRMRAAKCPRWRRTESKRSHGLLGSACGAQKEGDAYFFGSPTGIRWIPGSSIRASIASGAAGSPPDRLTHPSSVTRTTSSMRHPMPWSVR